MVRVAREYHIYHLLLVNANTSVCPGRGTNSEQPDRGSGARRGGPLQSLRTRRARMPIRVSLCPEAWPVNVERSPLTYLPSMALFSFPVQSPTPSNINIRIWQRLSPRCALTLPSDKTLTSHDCVRD